MSKVSGRAGSPGRIDQTRRPDARFLKKRAFEKQTLPEPPRLEKPRVYIFGRSPLRAFYYTKGARGKYHTADRVTRGTKWNAYLCSGTAIPKGTRPEIFRAPPTVSGLLSSMKTMQEKEIAAEHLHEHHVPASHVLTEHTVHSHHSSGTGWVDVPMPGMQTQFQQGAFVHLNTVHHHHHRDDSAPVMAEQVPTATISLQAVPFEIAQVREQVDHPAIQQAVQITQPVAYESLPEAQAPAEARQETIQILEVKKAAAQSADVPAQTHIPSKEPARLHFNQVQDEKPAAKTDKNTPEVAKPTDSKPQEFSAEVPRSEGIIVAPERLVEAITPPAEIPAHGARVNEIPEPAHVGYIPSVRKREKQLKVAQGAEGIPPQ